MSERERRARVEALARTHRVTIQWTDRAMYAIPAQRLVVIHPPTDDRTEAGCVHEIAHCVNGPCPETGVHRRSERGGCLECERLAWVTAMQLVPFTSTMYARLQSCLSTYRHSPRTPQPMPAAQAADLLMNFRETYAKPLQQRVEMDYRRELVATWQRDMNDQPNSLTTCRAKLAAALR